MQLYLRPFYIILRQQKSFEWTTKHQTRFQKIKKIKRSHSSNNTEQQ